MTKISLSNKSSKITNRNPNKSKKHKTKITTEFKVQLKGLWISFIQNSKMLLTKRIKRYHYQSNFFMIGIWNLLFQFSKNIAPHFQPLPLSEREFCFSSICWSFWAYLLLRITTTSSFILGLQRQDESIRYSWMCRWCTWWRRPQFKILAWISQWWQGWRSN